MKTILCIDDDAWILDTLHEALAPRGYRVLITTSTRAAVPSLKYTKVDLVLLDLNMPRQNGLALFRELEATAPVPVLFVTGCSRSFTTQAESFRKEYEQELKLAHTDVLAKPFTLAQLYEKVEAMIGTPDFMPSDEAPPGETQSLLKRLLHGWSRMAGSTEKN